MSRQFTPRVGPKIWKRVQDEYLDLILLAGRIAALSPTEGTSDSAPTAVGAPAADSVRSFAENKLTQCRQILTVKSIAEVGTDIAECEMITLHFVDSAATKYLPRWRPIHPDRVSEYKQVTRQDRFDLGRYLHDRMEGFRKSVSVLKDESTEILRFYHICFQLGYQASYESRPDELTELRHAIAQELRKRQETDVELNQDTDNRLSPSLKRIQSRTPSAISVSPLTVIGTAVAFLVVGVLSARTVLWFKEAQLTEKIENFTGATDGRTTNTDKACAPLKSEGGTIK